MLQKSSQSTKKECLIRKRKPLTAGAGVKHRVNCLSTLSALHSHTSSCSIKRNRSLSLIMSKPLKSTSKKSQEYVVKKGDQELVQQISKSGTIVLRGKDAEDSDLQNLTVQQKVKIIFILLMIPSAMVVFFGNSKFKSDSNNMNLANLGAMGGMGGGFRALGGGFGGGFGGGGRPHFSDHSRRHFDHDSIQERQ